MDWDLDRLNAIAGSALGSYGLDPDSSLTLLNISENATFRVDGAHGRSVLRIHRSGYHTRQAIESELAWIAALRGDGVVTTAQAIPTASGERVATAAHPDGEERHAVMFTWLEGTEPTEDRLVEDFATLGAITARLHHHARTWPLPEGFTRFTWNVQTSLGEHGHWGRWQDGMAVDQEERDILGRLATCIDRRLARFSSVEDRFGLIHADMRLANLLVTGQQVSVIDFDDCGFGWYLYDLGSSLSFIEDHPLVPELVDSWVRGYRQVGQLSADEEDELQTFIMLRRLLLVAWIGSHSSTDLAQSMGAEFTAGSCSLAEAYLTTFDR